jgi:hypothetical protein
VTTTLTAKLTQAPARDRVVQDCCAMIDEEVKSKGGLSGIAVKGAYGVVKAVKPTFVPEVVDAMLDDWIRKVEPYYDQWKAAGSQGSLATYLSNRSGEISESLLEVTDTRARGAKNASVKKLYEKMRPSARKHVEEAVPRLARLLEKHA